MDFFQTADQVMVAQVPTRGVRTLYARVGDAFAWACILGLVLVAVMVTFQSTAAPVAGVRAGAPCGFGTRARMRGHRALRRRSSRPDR